MTPEQWRKTVGEDVWSRALARFQELKRKPVWPNGNPVTDEEVMAETFGVIVSLASIRLPVSPPSHVASSGGRVLWPREDGGQTAVLTAAGLEKHWALRGHGFILLRAAQVCRAAVGPLLQNLADLLNAYEYRCTQEGVTPLPLVEGETWRAFVGGEAERVSDRALYAALLDASPKPEPTQVKKVMVQGRGAKATQAR